MESLRSPASTRRLPSGTRMAALWLAAMLACAPGTGRAEAPELVGPEVCGGYPPADNGPFDYRVVRDDRLKRVEQFHFTPNVQALTHGQSSANIGVDLGFVLRAFPNHHRAMLAVIQLGEKLNTRQPPGSIYTVGCWLERATRFAPGDAVARMIRANYLVKHGQTDEALEQLALVVAQAGDNALTHYNAGLIYLDMKAFDKALAQARVAYGMGMQRPELRDRLKQAGQWQEPEDAAAAQPPASAASR